MIFDLLLCGIDIRCYIPPKYPPEVYEICKYYEEQKTTLPEYCKWDIKPPRKRNEF
jgi:hypothetical protein